MYRQKPSLNKILSKKWDDKLMSIHHKRLVEMKPTHSNTSPKYFSHLITKPKHHMLQEGTFFHFSS